MKNLLTGSVIAEFEFHVQDAVNDGRLTLENKDDWHHELFNADYYIIGYHQAEQWLKSHSINSFAAVDACMSYEKENFGEVTKAYDNAETTVNMLVYVLGEYWLYSSEGIEYIESLEGLYPEAIIVCDRASLRPADLFDAFFGYIVKNHHDDFMATFDTNDNYDMLAIYVNWLASEDPTEFENYVASIDTDVVSYELNETLFDYMNDISPENMYFGVSEGDGSLFGFWLDMP